MSSTASKKCFICGGDASLTYDLTGRESAFVLKNIFQLPDSSLTPTQKIKFSYVCYCRECLTSIFHIRDLEEEVMNQKSKLEKRLKESCDKSKGLESTQIGMLQMLRQEIIAEIEKNRIPDSEGVNELPPKRPELTMDYSNNEHIVEGPSNIVSASVSEVDSVKYEPEESEEKNYDPEANAPNISISTSSRLSRSKRKIFPDIITSRPIRKKISKDSSDSEEVSSSDSEYSLPKSKPSLRTAAREKNISKKDVAKNTKKREFRKRIEKQKKRKSWACEEEKPCKICGKVLSSYSNWKIHMRVVHSNPKDFDCKICNLPFLWAANLRTHMETCHNGRPDFKCKYCSKGLTSKEILRKHQKRHEGLQGEFSCKICSAPFVCKRSLTIHMMGKTCIDAKKG